MSFPEKTVTDNGACAPWAARSPSDARLLALLGVKSDHAADAARHAQLTTRQLAQSASAYVRPPSPYVHQLLLAVSVALVLGFLGGCAWVRH